MLDYRYRARCIRVVDGDTLDLEIDLGFSVFVRERIRLLGIDTPEVYGVKKESEEYQAGKLASNRVTELIMGKDLIIETSKDAKGKYGRYLALVYIDDGTIPRPLLNDILVTDGLAKVIS